MPIPDVDPPQYSDTLPDAELQKELCNLFAIDARHYLQRYEQIAQRLQSSAWAEDIQELYRCIHTIKGGAVTIAAEAVLAVATALEDVLSDLRYLHPAPPLADGQLSQILLEAGELLSGTLELSTDESLGFRIEPTLDRIKVLHKQIRERFLPTWNAQAPLHQEFAEQGLELVVLDLEIALERTPEQGRVSESLVNTARQTVSQLQAIGRGLELATGWTTLLEQAARLFDYPYNRIWRSQWLRLFQALKECAKQGGQAVPFEWELPDILEENLEWDAMSDEDEDGIAETSDWDGLDAIDASHFDLLLSPPESSEQSIDWQSVDSEDPSADWTDSFGSDADIDAITNDDFSHPGKTIVSDVELSDMSASTLAPTDPATNSAIDPAMDSAMDLSLDALPTIDSFLDELSAWDEAGFGDEQSIFSEINVQIPEDSLQQTSTEWSEAVASLADSSESLNTSELAELPDFGTPVELNSEAQASVSPATSDHWIAPVPTQATDSLDSVQIPVTLQKLDQSAQYLVDTLLASRVAQGFYQTLQAQIMQLVALAQEGTQYITSLRQIQDDYALLSDLRQNRQGPVPERYRQGYTTLNRLLETSLRLAELGAEAEKTAQQTADSLLRLDTNLLKLQTTVEETRRLPFQNLGFRAKAILRDLVTRFGKPAQLLIEGEQLELDVSTLRNLEPVLLHLIRNAYAHGLELPDERLTQGKPQQGTIWISLQRRGNSFQFSVRDDGRGIDPEVVRARAESLGLRLTQTQTPADLLRVICQPGFSSETQVTEVAGRGVGMDVVVAQIDRLGGRLRLETTPGQGTTFHVQVPVPHLLVSCLLLQAGNRTFALPTEEIKTTSLFDTLTVKPTEDSGIATWMVEDETRTVPALDLLDYWQPRMTPRSLPDTAVCVAVAPEGTTQHLWLVADELIGQSDLLISPVPSPLIPPTGLIGISLQPNGALVPVLNAATIAEHVFASPRPSPTTRTLPTPSSEPEAPVPAILVVDDAALIRRRIEASLTAYGFTTHTCADGLEAWRWLQKHTPTLIITDIEMPNMDGFTLTDRCRQAGITTPILVVSSRLSEEWLHEAKRLGATDYLTKGFSTVELINKVNALML